MRSIQRFLMEPPSMNVPNNGLAASLDRDVFNDHLLLPAGSITLQRFHLGSKRPGELVEGPFGAVLLGDCIDVRKAASEGH